jgi:hypothetical protein
MLALGLAPSRIVQLLASNEVASPVWLAFEPL